MHGGNGGIDLHGERDDVNGAAQKVRDGAELFYGRGSCGYYRLDSYSETIAVAKTYSAIDSCCYPTILGRTPIGSTRTY